VKNRGGSLTRRGNESWAVEVGEALRIRREESGISQREAGEQFNQAQSVISEIETGIRLKPDIYIAYAHMLGADLAITFRNNEAGKAVVGFLLVKKEDTP